jgi:hypothetical protein
MKTKNLIEMAMSTLSRMNGGRPVVLHLDASMIHTQENGRQRYLPVLTIEGDEGYYRFPEGMRDQVSDHFGALIEPARVQVEAINRKKGYSPKRVREIVGAAITRSRHQ